MIGPAPKIYAESSKNRVGLDIGSSAIKILEISGQPNNPALIAFGFKDIRDMKKDSLAEVVKELASSSGVTSKEVCISVSGQSVIVRFISMPNMDEKSLEGAIRFEAEKFIPFDIASCIIDYKILKKDSQDNKLNIVLVAAKKNAVLDKIKIAETAGFQVKVVDTDCFASANAFLKNFPKLVPDKSLAIVNIGGSVVNMSIIRNDTVCFARDISIGSGDFVAFISKKMDIDIKTAGALIIDPAEKAQEVAESMRTVYGNLLEEIKLSFNYYENQGGRTIDEIYVSGRGSNLFGLNDVFQESFGSKPLTWKPFDFLDKSRIAKGSENLAAVENSFAVAAGLALR